MRPGGTLLIGISLKMYFDHDTTVRWCRSLRQQLKSRTVPTATEIVVLPSFPSLAAAEKIFHDTTIRLGAQDLFWEDSGPFTGEVDGLSLRQVGCTYAEIGHAERRELFHEDPTVLAAKVAAALRHELVPIVCVGERARGDSGDAARHCVSQLEQMCVPILTSAASRRLVVAYEPEWAIGADDHAPVDHIGEVCDAISGWMRGHEQLHDGQVIYGGSAGPGLLTALSHHIDGVFLGRAAHDVNNVDTIIDEAIDATAARAVSGRVHNEPA